MKLHEAINQILLYTCAILAVVLIAGLILRPFVPAWEDNVNSLRNQVRVSKCARHYHTVPDSVTQEMFNEYLKQSK